MKTLAVILLILAFTGLCLALATYCAQPGWDRDLPVFTREELRAAGANDPEGFGNYVYPER